MMTVKGMACRAHVSVRTLHHYDAIELRKPTQATEAGYRLYDEAALERLMMIMLYRELNFPLSKIASLLDAPDFDRNRALQEQIRLLREKWQHLATMYAGGGSMTERIDAVGGPGTGAFAREVLEIYCSSLKE